MTKKIAIIGAGPAGYPAALKAAALGAQVTLIEEAQPGGVCLNSGCIPSKSLLDAAHKFYELKKTAALTTDAAAATQLFNAVDFAAIQTRRGATIAKLQRGIGALLKKAGVNYIQGKAAFVSNNELTVNGQNINFDAAIIATGTTAFYPAPFDGYKDKIFDNSTIFNLNYIPKTMTILGGGVIGCEFACIFNALGCKVTIVELLPNIIAFEDDAAITALRRSFEKRGIDIITGVAAKEISFNGNQKIITLSNGATLAADEVLAALGRTVDLGDMCLQNIDVEWTKKGIKVNPKTMQVKDNIYAAGDITGLCLLAHAATAQGEVAAQNIMDVAAVYNNDLIPKAIYTWPEVASIGLSGAQAAAQGVEVKLHKTFMLAIGRAVAQDETDGFLQIVEDAQSGKIIGAQAVGQYAAEIIHTPLVAIAAQMTMADFKKLVFAHPTVTEGFKEG